MSLDLVALIVPDYDAAIRFYCDALRFELVEDVPARTTDGREKRWVVVRPRDGGTGFVLAKADGTTHALPDSLVRPHWLRPKSNYLEAHILTAVCRRAVSYQAG